MRRQKRKADSLQLNFVPLKRKSVSFKKVSYPINTLFIWSYLGPTSVCKPTTSFIESPTTGLELRDDDMYDTGPGFDASEKDHTHRKMKAVEAWNDPASYLL